jgi:hypothetical protein
MKNGIDTRVFAERIKAAEPAQRRRLLAVYNAWIVEGARAARPGSALRPATGQPRAIAAMASKTVAAMSPGESAVRRA